MKDVKQRHASLFLEVSCQDETPRLPLHSSIVVFLLSYCECKYFKVHLVSGKPDSSQALQGQLPEFLDVRVVRAEGLPPLVRDCRLPVVLDETGRMCRAGLAVVLRHIINKSVEAEPSRNDVLALLGFKKTCLKACAEVSKWTRLCEIGVPSAVEEHLRNPSSQQPQPPPPAILTLERRLAEPVKVHNDDKIRRQKLKQLRQNGNNDSSKGSGDSHLGDGLELKTALAKLSVAAAPNPTTRERSEIRKVKTNDLPVLEHVFAEGLYFTLTDVVLLPCIHQYLENGIEAAFAPHPCPEWTLPWDSLPDAINPTEGKMSSIRTVRKKQQLNNLVAMVTQLAKPGYTVVDFCSGTGHVGIVLAHALPRCQVILIENKEESLIRAHSRSAKLGLENIGFIQTNLDYFTGPFQIGVALHACGVATDMVTEHCIQAGAAFVVSPCCYGFIQNAVKFTFPRSKKFQETLIYKEHMVLCRFADQTAPQLPPERRLIGKQCMGLVDLDRSWSAESHGYRVQVMTMEPETCSPKNNMLVGRPGVEDGPR
ncbi:glutathione S-transferase C-terminal domain-containing protein isoform X2 [Phycodurus eques]|uniref:glutathione S-transferase C-terminal domain-containing protein isoform X2 n=1 Tax=Phycodurus eques TaxID=693459 RepID=UPI002ACD7D38|nr:glutathione S-transferase C-terminal domain-containing protein isoform X2 [Phycodurus eques]